MLWHEITSVLQTFTSFRQNNKLYMVTPCYDMKSPVFCKISHLSTKITIYIWWLHVMTWNHQRALQNFTSFRQNNKLWWLHVMTWNHQIILATGYAFFRVVGVGASLSTKSFTTACSFGYWSCKFHMGYASWYGDPNVIEILQQRRK